ncbi:MAG: cytochrome c family protein [Gammaproteobacteria bacterium]
MKLLTKHSPMKHGPMNSMYGLRILLMLFLGLGYLTACQDRESIDDRAESVSASQTQQTADKANKNDEMPEGAKANQTHAAADAASDQGASPDWVVPFKKSPGTQLNLAYIGNINGELEPCGCTVETDYGGLKRQASVLKALRKTFEPLMVLSTGGLLDDFDSNTRIKNQFILEGMSLLAYDAIAVQARDLTFGVDFVGQHRLPWVISNTLPKTMIDDAENVATLGLFDHMSLYKAERDIAVFSILSPKAIAAMKASGLDDTSAQHQDIRSDNSRPKNDADSLAKTRERMAELAGSDTLLVMISALEPDALSALLDLTDVDIIITPTESETFAEPARYGKTLWLRPGNRGMRLGLVQIDLLPLGGPGERLKVMSHDVIELDNTVPDAEEMAQWYEQYNTAVAADYAERSAQQKQYQSDKARYLGVTTCEQCHQQIVAHWRTTQHSQAHQTLVDKGKALDPGCLKCHTVAFHEPGGFIDMTMTHHLANVQCESCHRETAAHVKNPSEAKPQLAQEGEAQKTCLVCHNSLHSPRFSFETYWPRVAHDQQGKIDTNAPEQEQE